MKNRPKIDCFLRLQAFVTKRRALSLSRHNDTERGDSANENKLLYSLVNAENFDDLS